MDLHSIARALGGEVSHNAVLAPGPGHSSRDRSLSVRPCMNSPGGFIVFSHAGDDFRACRDYVRERLGLPADSWRDHERERALGAATPPAGSASDLTARIARAVAIWDEARDLRGTIVERYLAGRRLDLDVVAAGTALRFHPACPWKDKTTGEMLRVPAMVAALRQVDTDQITAIHRTRLSADGVKLGRMMLGPSRGATIKLDPDDAVTLGLTIGEGIETTLAAHMLGFRPAWAMGCAGGIAKLPVLAGVETLTILTERDETGANERATDECGERWHAAGREVILVEPKFGNDVNDALRGIA